MELKASDTVKNSCFQPFQAHVNHTAFTLCQLKDWGAKKQKLSRTSFKLACMRTW